MTQHIPFTKMHGAGNDYIYVNTLLYNIEEPEQKAIEWSRRHTGIGSDGLVLICASPVEEADFSMRIFNADGSEAMMCGNAARCVGKYVYERGLTTKTSIRLHTLSGIKVLRLQVADGFVTSVTVDMGVPTVLPSHVDMGNPHRVVFVDDVMAVDVAGDGSRLEHDGLFPDGVNVEFVQVMDGATVRMRVWERGSGITMACGTGACAAAVAAAHGGRTGRRVQVQMDGGTLDILWDERDNHVYMTGPAEFVFEGEILT